MKKLAKDGSALMWWDWNSIQSSPLPFNRTPRASTLLYGALVLFFYSHSGGLENLKHLLFLRVWMFLDPGEGRALKQFRTTGSYLQERRWWELPSLPSGRRQRDLQDHQRSGSASPPTCAGGGCQACLACRCLTAEEWFELARAAETHYREHGGCL